MFTNVRCGRMLGCLCGECVVCVCLLRGCSICMRIVGGWPLLPI